MPASSSRRTGIVLAAVFASVLAVAVAAESRTLAGRPDAGGDPGTVRVIAFNDLHGTLEPPTGSSARVTGDDGAEVDAGGAAYLAAHVERLRAEEPDSVLLSTGDNIGASPLASALFRDEPTIEVLDGMGVAASVAGNHEFDEGITELRRIAGGGCHPSDGCRFTPSFDGASFPVLAANVTEDGGGPALPATHVVEAGGTRIGIIGATLTELPGLVSPDGLRGLEIGDEVAAVDAASRDLTAQGVRAQVLLLHQGDDSDGGPDSCALEPGGPGSRIAAAVSADVDAVLSAHSHQQYVCSATDPAGAPRPFVQGLSFGRLLSVLDLTITADGDVDRAATTARNEIVSHDVEPDPAAQEIVDRAVAGSAPLAERPVGTLAGPLPRAAAPSGLSPLGTVIADAHLAASRGDGAQLALTNPGGVRADLVPDAEGRVTYGQAYTVQPFGNVLQTMTLTGAQLRAVLDQQFTVEDGPTVLQTSSNVRYAVAGERVGRVEVDGVPIADDRPYRVAVNNFLSAGGDGFDAFSAGTDLVGGPVDLDALVAHLGAAPRLTAPPTDRIGRG
ncbi:MULTISPECIES: bifunctional UDP-sugar hydrolase/5'-nucleotidase [unclassified Pseudonocardia]|uniref:bifunctional metallophosphatase/5'-nucleotidase n=1 Tax=unclassified Pseudonocardia TaxID=2619320 RepID=UPI0001FFF386|nr:bifunctional UDP-sugar hydrolase/5'-nucleotidase [Pseudonocardia sp. Ae707_Ps1]OLM16891.1 5'-nucleotidase [Pseudonocardia sp. Ae707_Ps1]